MKLPSPRSRPSCGPFTGSWRGVLLFSVLVCLHERVGVAFHIGGELHLRRVGAEVGVGSDRRELVLDGELPGLDLPLREGSHGAAASEAVRREPGIPDGMICREYLPVHGEVARAGVGVVHGVILPVGAELHDARVCHLLIVAHVVGRLYVGAEDEVGLQRVEPLIALALEEVVHVLSELREGVPVFQGGEYLVIEPLEDLRLCVARDGEGEAPVLLDDAVEDVRRDRDAALEILDRLLEGHVLPGERALNPVHVRAPSPRGWRRP